MKIEREEHIVGITIESGNRRNFGGAWPVYATEYEPIAKIELASGTLNLRTLTTEQARALGAACETRRRVKLTLECDDGTAKHFVNAARSESRAGNTKRALKHALTAIEMLTGEK